MSNNTIPHSTLRDGGETGSARLPATLGALAATGLLLLLPGRARAGGYGSAEITLGFPHAQVTLGHTWDDEPNHEVVEEEIHKAPPADADDEVRYEDDGDDDPDRVVVEKRIVEPNPETVIVRRYEEPSCDHVHVIRRVYVDPGCDRVHVIRRVYAEPRVYERGAVVYRPDHARVIYRSSRGDYAAPQVRERVYSPGGSHADRSYQGDRGPRNLFPQDGGRPMPMRGVQHRVATR